MKRQLTLIALFVALLATVKAQNVQVHYDLSRQAYTSTVEMFKPDKYGSTFFFIDMDYVNADRNITNGVSLAYWEIARSFKWSDNQKFEPRVEFNSGILKLDGAAPFIPIENCYLAGAQYTFNNADFSKIFTVQANYKVIEGKDNSSFQFTGVWVLQFLDRKLTFTGFADFWKEEMIWGSDYRFLTEPQLWWNFNSNFSAGGEVEISNNFVGEGFSTKPTLAVKWNF